MGLGDPAAGARPQSSPQRRLAAAAEHAGGGGGGGEFGAHLHVQYGLAAAGECGVVADLFGRAARRPAHHDDEGRIELSPEVVRAQRCAATSVVRHGDAARHQLIDVYGQLVFLRLASADDSGRAGAPGLIPALHFRLQYAGTWQSEYMSTAEIIASILKPLTVRHTKTQSRNGEALLSLPPVHHNTVLIPPTDHEAAAYAAARAAAAEALAAGRHRLHAHAALAATLLCSGVTGKLAEDLETRQSGLTARKTSGRGASRQMKQRDDTASTRPSCTRPTCTVGALDQRQPRATASCLQRVTSLNGQGAVALAPCGHLLCVGCRTPSCRRRKAPPTAGRASASACASTGPMAASRTTATSTAARTRRGRRRAPRCAAT